MARFSDLSPELITNIMSFLVLTADLRNISFVSKPTATLAEPFLYQTYRDGRNFPQKSNQPFLRSILGRPELASHVKLVALRAWDTSDNVVRGVNDPDCPIPPPEQVEQYKAAISRLDLQDAEWEKRWMKELSDGVEDAEIALILALCTRLEEFCFEEVHEPQMVYKIFEWASKRNGTQPDPSKPLSAVTSICAESQEHKYGFLGFYECAVFFRLPSLQSFEAILANSEDEGEYWSEDKIPAGSSNVSELLFVESAMEAGPLKAVVGKCKIIKTFVYTYGRIHMYGLHFTARDVLEALRPHAETLETLHLNLDEDWEKVGWEELEDEKLYLGSLKPFKKLKRLHCGQQCLLGLLANDPVMQFTEGSVPSVVTNPPKMVNVLPPNIEELQMLNCDGRIEAHLNTLANAKNEGKLPKLKKVSIVCLQELTSLDRTDERHVDVEELSGFKDWAPYDYKATFEDADTREARIQPKNDNGEYLYGKIFNPMFEPRDNWGSV